MEELINIIIKLAATLLVAGIGLLVERGIVYLKGRLDEQKQKRLDTFVDTLVVAADQMFKEEDASGFIRLDYVQRMLVEAGYEVTEAVRALIESKVLELNLAQKGS